MITNKTNKKLNNMTTDKELIEVAEKIYSIKDPIRDVAKQVMLKKAFIDGAEFQKTRWNEGVNIPDTEHEKGQTRNILIVDKNSKVVFVGWYHARVNRYFKTGGDGAIKPETIKWQEIYLP